MIAYRAGRIPRYQVNCPVGSDRASFDLPLERIVSPSSIG
jgi:hypothetical protein